jgi:hypothetical protein
MTNLKVRIVRAAAVVFAAGVVVLSGVVPASADITASSVKVTAPTSNQVITGSFDSGGTASGFKITFKGQATTNCSAGWQSIKFTVTGPSYSTFFNVAAPSGGTWNGSAPSAWDSQPLRNGLYDVRLDVVEKDTIALTCNGAAASAHVPVKIANPAQRPQWSSAPDPASNGSANVTLRWKKNAEDDVLEYRIVRTGPDGTKVAPVSAASPGGQGCSVSSSVYTCTDKSFGAAYTGEYSYGIVAMRERPAYNSSEDNKIECDTVSKPCVSSAGSEIQSVSLVAPTPSPTPTDQSTYTPPTIQPGTPSSKPKPGTTSGGTRVLSFGSDGGFFSGTYSESLPYTPRSMILGGGSATSSPRAAGYQGEVVSETAPDFRTIMLPVAGGLLAFLSAAHVRRLMVHL